MGREYNLMDRNYDFTEDYKRKINEYIDKFEQLNDLYERSYRMELIEELIDAYVEQVGKRPDDDALARLTDVILHEELTDRSKTKTADEEYPFLSDVQYERRTTGRRRRRASTGVTHVEVPLTHAINVATDGRNYTPPKRSYENKGPFA